MCISDVKVTKHETDITSDDLYTAKAIITTNDGKETSFTNEYYLTKRPFTKDQSDLIIVKHKEYIESLLVGEW